MPHTPERVLVLHNIRSVHNVGSLFRTADAAGVARIILSGYTPGPIDHFGRLRSDFCKVSLGAEQSVPWSHARDISTVVRTLKKESYLVAMLEQHQYSVSLFEWQPPARAKVALVLGNEVRGISAQTLRNADAILEIPMHGKKESLNVSVAGGIALFALAKQR